MSSDAVPEELDVRLERRDTSGLRGDVVVRFQRINRGPSPAPNYRWELHEDGALHLARHSGDTSDPYTPFDTDLPSKPTIHLEPDAIDDVLAALQAAGFAAQPPYQVDETVEDGAFTIITARLDGEVHEVIYEGVRPPPVPSLEDLERTAELGRS